MLGKTLSAPDSIVDIDRWAWDAICHWPDHSGFNATINGIDYAHLTRHFLWDKVARAVRQQRFPEQFAFEASLMPGQQVQLGDRSQPNFRRLLRHTAATGRTTKVRAQSYLTRRPIVYIPRSHHQLQSSTAALVQSLKIMAVTHCSQSFSQATLPAISTRPGPYISESFAHELYQAIVAGLKAENIVLPQSDLALLQRQLRQQQQHVQAVETELAMLRPAGVFVFSDNHYPSQEYVAVARRDGIPTIMLQHGLDCESFCLDEAYASTIAVWGKSRLQRYQQASQYQPLLRITGNPEYDHLRLPEEFNEEGQYWLWFTRPHISQKCFVPSRHPEEGLVIFDALLSALRKFPEARLIIKPHPSDYIELYERRIKDNTFEQRISVSSQPIEKLVYAAQVVFSEDSTAALGAMFNGKPLIHLHFTKTPPVLPMAEFGAALPAYSEEMLHEALVHINQFTLQEKDNMLSSQRAFIEHFAGPCDGHAAQRVAALVEDSLQKR